MTAARCEPNLKNSNIKCAKVSPTSPDGAWRRLATVGLFAL